MNGRGSKIMAGDRGTAWTVLLLLALALLPAPLPAAESTAATAVQTGVVSERLFGLPGLSNMGRVAPGIYRGAQPEDEGYGTLKELGVRTVINLRSSMSEKEAVEAAGMRSIEIPMSAAAGISREEAERVVALMVDPENQPVFLHCRHGKDRTGAVAAVYRQKVDGWDVEAAVEEMQSFGFNDLFVRLMRLVKNYPERGGR